MFYRNAPKQLYVSITFINKNAFSGRIILIRGKNCKKLVHKFLLKRLTYSLHEIIFISNCDGCNDADVIFVMHPNADSFYDSEKFIVIFPERFGCSKLITHINYSLYVCVHGSVCARLPLRQHVLCVCIPIIHPHLCVYLSLPIYIFIYPFIYLSI